MSASHWIFSAGLGFFLVSAFFQLSKILRNPGIIDPAVPNQSSWKGVRYSFTGAMSPWKKESAYLHLPSYLAGVIFHIGTFISFFWVIVHALGGSMPGSLEQVSLFALIVTTACGLGIFIKRITLAKLRLISTPDDYFSNLLVTVFQGVSAAALTQGSLIPSLLGYTGFLLLYIPMSKLRHAFYFFLARFYLGVFYGKRGVWHRRNLPV